METYTTLYSYYPSGSMKSVTVQNEQTKKISSNGDYPAIHTFFENGKTHTLEWFLDGHRHRADFKPAFIVFSNEGCLLRNEYFLHGKRFCDQTHPSVEHFYPSLTGSCPIERREFILDSVFHRDSDLPAIESYTKKGVVIHQEWFVFGVPQRSDPRRPVSILYNKGTPHAVVVLAYNGTRHYSAMTYEKYVKLLTSNNAYNDDVETEDEI